MNYLAVDDEKYSLEEICDILKSIDPSSSCAAFTSPAKALEWANCNSADIALLDIELGSINGIEFAKKLSELCPTTKIIFITGYSEYAIDAFSIHAAGYLLKPVIANDLQKEIERIKSQTDPFSHKKIQVKTFGGFDIFVNGKPVTFSRAKSKELLACLVDRRGNSISTRNAVCLLFDDDIFDETRASYFRALVSDLRRTLENAGISNILVRSRNCLAICPELIDCDFYRFLNGDPEAIRSYRHDYMIDYSWAELSTDFPEKKG